MHFARLLCVWRKRKERQKDIIITGRVIKNHYTQSLWECQPDLTPRQMFFLTISLSLSLWYQLMSGWVVGWVKLAARQECTEWAVSSNRRLFEAHTHSSHTPCDQKRESQYLSSERERNRVRLVEQLRSERWIAAIRKWLQSRRMSDLIDFKITWRWRGGSEPRWRPCGGQSMTPGRSEASGCGLLLSPTHKAQG